MPFARIRNTLSSLLVLSAVSLSATACSSTTSGSAAGATTATNAAVTSATTAAAGSGITISCSALTTAQIVAAMGGAPSAGQTVARPGGGECDWSVPGSKLQTGQQDPANLSLESNQFTGEDSWLEYESSALSAESSNGYAALPDIDGDSAYWNPDSPVNLTDEIQLWDGSKEVVLGLVLDPNPADAAARAAVQDALTTLTKDLTKG